ncbi:MAG: proteasome subunit alpha [Egibacteraceae bacterium]
MPMGMPYISPEQSMKDKADYARKGISRGRAVVAITYDDGILFVAENPSSTLNKISEIYDRIAFAATGRYNEYEGLRQSGIMFADVRGFQYSRQDVTGRSIANAYANAIGANFSEQWTKPLEVELLVAELTPATIEIYHILYDGSISDEKGYVAIGGGADAINERLGQDFSEAMSRDVALQTAQQALGGAEGRTIDAEHLEVAGLDRRRNRRKFFRLDTPAIAAALQAEAEPHQALEKP